MTEEQIALAKRAVACRGWRWMPGMRTDLGERVSDDDAQTDAPTNWTDDLPDLTDPATLGCLLTLVREAWGKDDMGAVRIFRHGLRKWCVEHDEDDALVGAFYGPTEAHTLVAALEAAP